MGKQLNLVEEANQVETQTPEKHDKARKEQKLRAAITSAVNLESAFKLYSYRLISEEDFIQAVEQIKEEMP